MERRTLAERVAGIPMFERKAQVIRIRARQAEFAETQEALPGIVAENLRKRGIERLFTHQAQAIDAVRSGKDVVVVTGTNSGKTICFAVPWRRAMFRAAFIKAMSAGPKASKLSLLSSRPGDVPSQMTRS